MTPPVLPRMFLLVGSQSVSKQLGQALSGSVTHEIKGSAEEPPVPRKVNEMGLAGSEAVLVEGGVLGGTGLELQPSSLLLLSDGKLVHDERLYSMLQHQECQDGGGQGIYICEHADDWQGPDKPRRCRRRSFGSRGHGASGRRRVSTAQRVQSRQSSLKQMQQQYVDRSAVDGRGRGEASGVRCPKHERAGMPVAGRVRTVLEKKAP